ncbi:hypothetical protein FDI38_gp103 [Streptomyces phage Peebs]|uniref:Uncharacterized protein n=2 Tax=Samistivirus peebs TaxID=2560790 RepID=A0A222Z1D9_9CAUD|nr:hypothetical protein FDI38_gp103 [Streptomyces phage Peebs]ASR77864.1 hypothetical protein SEA_PEEBS_201 [Streptomyces phage Peebs]QAX95896.1 hypothetical protein SEA_TEUTSCH_203 [Streptomyces phage Teutsch]
MESAVDLVMQSYQLVYPDAPYEWLEKAANETLHWSARVTDPTLEQMNAHQARIDTMCRTGQWNV